MKATNVASRMAWLSSLARTDPRASSIHMAAATFSGMFDNTACARDHKLARLSIDPASGAELRVFSGVAVTPKEAVGPKHSVTSGLCGTVGFMYRNHGLAAAAPALYSVMNESAFDVTHSMLCENPRALVSCRLPMYNPSTKSKPVARTLACCAG